jgi:hypothetical protein
MPDHIHQIRSIRPVGDRERRLEANAVGILPQDSSADSMEGASPRQVDLTYAHGCTGDAFDTTGHVESGSAEERQQQNPVGIDAVDDEVGDPVGQGLGLGLARPSALLSTAPPLTPCLTARRCSWFRSAR